MAKFIIYKDKKEFLSGILQEEKNGRIYLKNEKKISINISKDKIVKTFELKDSNITVSNKEQFSSQSYSHEELYNLLSGLKEEYTLDEILELIYQDNYSYKEYYEILKLITKNEPYFSSSLDENNLLHVKLKSEEDVKNHLRELEVANKEQKDKNQFKDLSNESFIDEITNILTQKKENILVQPSENLCKHLSILKELVIIGEEYSKKKEALSKFIEIQKLLNKNIQNISINDVGLFLEKINIIDPYSEEIFIRKYKLRTAKNKYTENDIKNDEIERYRKDLTNLLTFTIDDVDTMDIDDGVSVEKIIINGGINYKIYIHIADPDSVIKRGENIDNEAYKRSSSVYLPNKVINMLPNDLSDNLVSLVENKLRNCLTLQLDLDENLNVEDSQIYFSKINVNNNFSYDEIDNYFNCSKCDTNTNNKYLIYQEPLLLLKKFSEKLIKDRIVNKAIIIQQPEVKFFLNTENKIDYRLYNIETTSHNIVRELMIIFNTYMAKFFIDNKIFALFVSQEEPQYNVDFDIHKEFYTKEEMIKIFSILKKSVISTSPSFHFMMGLNYYTQMTSPIRRYQDITNHRILKDYLIYNRIQYSNDKLNEIAYTISNNVSNIRQAEKDSFKYWVLRYLEENKNETFSGLVTKRIPGGIMCTMDTFNIRLKVNGNDRVELFDKIYLRVKSILPFQLDARIVYSLNSN